MDKNKVKVSNEWMFDIKIKHLLSDSDNPQISDIKEICDQLIRQTSKVIEQIDKSKIVKDEKFYFIGEIEELQSGVEELKSYCDNKDSWVEFGFNGDFVSELNRILNHLYDIGDNRCLSVDNSSYKLIWIK